MTPQVLNRYAMPKHIKAETCVYVGRGSPWRNPYWIGKDRTRNEVIEKFRLNVLPKLDLRSLRGKNLICFCAPRACHADLLLKAANR